MSKIVYFIPDHTSQSSRRPYSSRALTSEGGFRRAWKREYSARERGGGVLGAVSVPVLHDLPLSRIGHGTVGFKRVRLAVV